MTSRLPLGNVAVLVPDEVSPFELGVAAEVFGMDRTAQGLPRIDFAVCRAGQGPVTTKAGFAIDTPYGLERLESADLVLVPNWKHREVPSQGVADALRAVVRRGALVAGFCSGAFALAHAGLLTGRRATTHWAFAPLFTELFPDVDLDPTVLYVADGPVLTSAGTAAALDLCLHLVCAAHGHEVANVLARRMIVPPHRSGGQAQYIDLPVPCSPDSLAPLLEWMNTHLSEDLGVDDLARKALMSPRTFARRFRAETGTTPHDWLTGQRVLHARRLLETTQLPIERIAASCGFHSAAALRHHFTRIVRTSPLAYRRAFTCDAS